MKARYSNEDIRRALKMVGIKGGDAVYVTTSLGFIGYPPEKINSIDQLCAFFYKMIWRAIGASGTLIIPAFSYTFGKGTEREPAMFDPKNTPADIGAFPNFALKQRGIKRSLDPMACYISK